MNRDAPDRNPFSSSQISLNQNRFCAYISHSFVLTLPIHISSVSQRICFVLSPTSSLHSLLHPTPFHRPSHLSNAWLQDAKSNPKIDFEKFTNFSLYLLPLFLFISSVTTHHTHLYSSHILTYVHKPVYHIHTYSWQRKRYANRKQRRQRKN